MNYFQSTDFNAGVIYTIVEKVAVNLIREKSVTSTIGDFTIPAIQVIPAGMCSIIEEDEVIKATIKIVAEHFDAVYGKRFSLNIYSWKRDKQYFKFNYGIARKEEYKEMTVTEIEKALGHKVKIVAEGK